MIDPTPSNLYKLNSKKYLMNILHIYDKRFLQQSYVAKQISPYIRSGRKPRLIEAPSPALKKIQSSIKRELDKIIIPENIFSGVKGKSYVGNAEVHTGIKYVLKIDLTAFFPYITRNLVYQFFEKSLKTAPDIACILTNLVTVDLTQCKIKDVESIETFFIKKKIKTSNHLISGSPASPKLSYLVNYQMFDALQTFSDKNDLEMSVYVDDITFSSNHAISHRQKEIIYGIISKNTYRISANKLKYYTKRTPKRITGAIISSAGDLRIPNALRLSIYKEWKKFIDAPDNIYIKSRLLGLILAAQQIEPEKYKNMYKYVKNVVG